MAERGRKLTPRQARFVVEYVRNGGNAAAAARTVGYRESTARFNAHLIPAIPHVLAAIRIEVQKKLDSGVALAAGVLEKLAREANSEAVRLQAAEALLNRGGMRLAALTQHEHTHLIRDERSDAELRARVLELQRELGIRTVDGEVVRPALPARLVDDVVDVPLVQIERAQVERTQVDRDDAADVESEPKKPGIFD